MPILRPYRYKDMPPPCRMRCLPHPEHTAHSTSVKAQPSNLNVFHQPTTFIPTLLAKMDAPNALKHDTAASSGLPNQSTVLSPHAATFVTAMANESFVLSPHAATFVAAMANESNLSSVLSPHATPFVAKLAASKLSPYAATFAATPAAEPTQGGAMVPSLNPASRALLSDAPQPAAGHTPAEAILSSLDPALRALLSDAVEY
jgi:hypothetical protein